MKAMFQNCQDLEELDLSNFNTSKVSDMESMFNQCIQLKKLDLSKFNIKSDYKTRYIFNFVNKNNFRFICEDNIIKSLFNSNQ